jgi:2'-5' RNA ligase
MTNESALVVFVPEAEALVASFRREHDPSAAAGVPAHVTVLYPFKAPCDLTKDVIDILRELFSRAPGFLASFAQVRRFPDTVYLAPEPLESFRRLTQLVVERFPETPPCGGEFKEVVPHLTVAQVADARELEGIAATFRRAAEGHLPIASGVGEVVLMENRTGSWQVRDRFSLC